MLRKIWLFWLLIWHFIATGTSVKFDASNRAAVVLLGLGAILVLPLARMPLMKLYWQHGTSVLPSCVCYLAHLGPHLYSQSGCVRLTALGQPSAGSGTCSYLTFDIDPYSLAEDGFCFVTVPAQTLTNVELSFQNVFGRRLDHYPLPPSSCYLCPSPRGSKSAVSGMLGFSDCWFDISWPMP